MYYILSLALVLKKVSFMNKNFVLPIILTVFLVSACGLDSRKDKNDNNSSSNGATSGENILLKKSSLPFEAPDFDRIKNGDFKPAIEAGIKAKSREIAEIASNEEEPTFGNTFIALESSGQELDRVLRIFYLLTGANTNDVLKDVRQEMAPKLAALRDEVFLNDKIFQKVKTIHGQLSSLDLDAESKRLVEYYYEQFILSGANLEEDKKEELRKLNAELAELTTSFSNKLLAADQAASLVVSKESDLAGLTASEIKSAADRANARGNENKYEIPLLNTTQQPALQNLENRETRHSLFVHSVFRAEKDDENDTRSTILRIAKVRAQQAKLLGYKNYAEWNLQDQMAKTPEAVQELMNQIVPAATAKAQEEAAEIQKMINETGEDFTLEPWDWNHYAEKVRLAKYDLDEDQIKPYFELNTVLEDGVFYAANQLYGLTFSERSDIPVYHEDVRVFEVFDHDGTTIGLFYADYFKRDNKRGGAWMSNIVGQSKMLKQKPVIYNVCNYTKPADGEPALLSFDNVITLFHEFGHALHGFFADQTYPSLSGTAVARDFVEFPSQFNEHWALYPSILNNYAKHYKSDEVIPQELVDKIQNASTFNQGYDTVELMASTQLDMQWHMLSADDTVMDVVTFEREALRRTGLDLSQVPPRYRTTYFSHVWGGGYAAGYYAYTWTKVLDDDAYSWFEENGGLTRENGQRFRDMILSRGNTLDYNQMFEDFRGHAPDITPMLKARGLIK